MSTLRRYLAPLFASCVALAIGVALGAGPLQGTAGADSTGGSGTHATALQDRITSLEGGQSFRESLTRSVSGNLLASRLDQASVTVVVLPGVSASTVSGVENSLAQSGATVAITARVAPKLVDPAHKTYTASVAATSIQGLRDLSTVAPGEAYAQIGALLARAYVGSGSDLTMDDEAVKIDSELRGAKLVGLDEDPHRRGSLVIVLAAGDHGRDDVTAATHLIEVELLSALADAADAVMVATPPTGTAPGGLLEAMRTEHSLADAPVSSINVADGAAADIAIVYALAATADGTTGRFGIEGRTVTLPPGLAVRGG